MKYIHLSFLALLLLAAQTVNAQKTYLRDQVCVSGSYLLYDHLHFQNQLSETLKSKYTMSFDLGATYRHFFSNGAGLGLTVGFTMPPISTNFSMQSPTSSSTIITNKSTKFKQTLLSLALSEQAAFGVDREGQYYITAEAGARVFFDLSKPWEIEYEETVALNDSTNLQVYDFSLKKNNTILFGLFIKLGFLQAMSSGNTIQCAAVLNYNFKNANEGHYSYNDLTTSSSGYVKQPASFIGIELTYGFTLRSGNE